MKTGDIKITPKWSKSKEEIWDSVFENLEDTPKVVEMILRKRTIWFYAAASVALIALILPGIAFLYTKSETAERGTHLAVVLPDGSEATLNAESRIKYKPLWWIVSRKVELHGEGYFNVKKGSIFDVHSGSYTVSVLGTSFNIVNRANKFSVTCLTGKVSVSDLSQSLILTPGMQANVINNKLISATLEDADSAINWKHGKFVFVSVPLKDVIQEIERQYDIKVSSDSSLDYIYSGNFPKLKDPNDVLKIVGTTFGIEFEIN
jgi:Fe2+-dicitrate sensor, membrane component